MHTRRQTLHMLSHAVKAEIWVNHVHAEQAVITARICFDCGLKIGIRRAWDASSHVQGRKPVWHELLTYANVHTSAQHKVPTCKICMEC